MSITHYSIASGRTENVTDWMQTTMHTLALSLTEPHTREEKAEKCLGSYLRRWRGHSPLQRQRCSSPTGPKYRDFLSSIPDTERTSVYQHYKTSSNCLLCLTPDPNRLIIMIIVCPHLLSWSQPIIILTLTIVDTNRRTKAATCRKTIPSSRSSMLAVRAGHGTQNTEAPSLMFHGWSELKWVKGCASPTAPWWNFTSLTDESPAVIGA